MARWKRIEILLTLVVDQLLLGQRMQGHVPVLGYGMGLGPKEQPLLHLLDSEYSKNRLGSLEGKSWIGFSHSPGIH